MASPARVRLMLFTVVLAVSSRELPPRARPGPRVFLQQGPELEAAESALRLQLLFAVARMREIVAVAAVHFWLCTKEAAKKRTEGKAHTAAKKTLTSFAPV